MITMPLLKAALFKIFFNGDPVCEHLVIPLQGNWWSPTLDDIRHDTWVGYTILSTRPHQRAEQYGQIKQKVVKTSFRLTCIGPQAEEWINSTLLWEVRGDVNAIFEKSMTAQINYNQRQIYPRSYEQEGQNSTLAWVTDLDAMSYYAIDTEQRPWVPIGGSD